MALALALLVIMAAIFLGALFDRGAEGLFLGLTLVFLFSLTVKRGMTLYEFLVGELRRHRHPPPL
ncbi:MAG: hypothetical protein ACRD2Q_02175 [Terriglobales bacterium]